MKTNRITLAALAALFTATLFAADPPKTPPAPVLAPADELAVTKLLRRIDHDQIVIDQAAVAQKDQQEATLALRAIVARISPAGWHLMEPTPGEMQFVKNDAEPAVPVLSPKPTATK
jgi:hypothetical protein